MILSPSLLAADFGNLQQAVQMVNASEADWFHIDIMDGVFVPNISYGMPVLSAINKHATKPLDVHLMIIDPDRYISTFAKLGSHILTVHYEDVDLLLLMSVNPGFGGQSFIENTYKKVRQAKALITQAGANTLIEIDGGVTLSNAKALVEAGADALVAGSFVFNAANPTQTIAGLKAKA